MKREKVINLLKEYFDNGGYFKDLSRRISFKTESQNPKNFSKLEEYLSKEILPYLSKLGFNCSIYENPDPQFKGPFLFDSLCIAFATSSLPVPVSPKTKTLVLDLDTIWISFFNSLLGLLIPMIISSILFLISFIKIPVFNKT